MFGQVLPEEQDAAAKSSIDGGDGPRNRNTQCPQEEQFVDEQDPQPEAEEAPPLDDPPAPRAEYLPFDTLERIFLVFFDLHRGHAALGFSLKLRVTTSKSFLHLSHVNS